MPYALAGCRTRRSKVDLAGQHCLPEAATAPPARRPPRLSTPRAGQRPSLATHIRARRPQPLHTYALARRNRPLHRHLTQVVEETTRRLPGRRLEEQINHGSRVFPHLGAHVRQERDAHTYGRTRWSRSVWKSTSELAEIDFGFNIST